jgi:hypothetical protein
MDIIEEYSVKMSSTLYIQLDIKYSNYVQDDSVYIFNGILEQSRDQLKDETYEKGKEWVKQLNKDNYNITMIRQGQKLSFNEDIGNELDSQIFEIILKKLDNETNLDKKVIKKLMNGYKNDYFTINDVTESMRKSTTMVPKKTINSLDELLNRHKQVLETETYVKGKEWVEQLNKDNSNFTMIREGKKLYFDEDIGKNLSNDIKIFYVGILLKSNNEKS